MPKAHSTRVEHSDDDDDGVSENTTTRETQERAAPRQSRTSFMFSAIHSAYSSRFDAALERRRIRQRSSERRRAERTRQSQTESAATSGFRTNVSTAASRPVLRHPLASQIGSGVTGISNTTLVPRRDYDFTDEELSCFPPSMAHCFTEWLKLEQTIRGYSHIEELRPFLRFLTKCISIPFRSHRRLFPYWAYPDTNDIRKVIETAECHSIGVLLPPQIHDDLVNWTFDTRRKLNNYGDESNRYRQELRVLWAVRAGTAQRRRSFAQRAQEDHIEYEEGVLPHDKYYSRMQSFREQKHKIDSKLEKIDEAIGILKAIRYQRNQDPDNLRDNTSIFQVPLNDYESTNEVDREVLGYISKDMRDQAFRERYQETGLQRTLGFMDNDDAMVMARLADYQCKFRPSAGRQVTDTEMAEVDSYFAVHG